MSFKSSFRYLRNIRPLSHRIILATGCTLVAGVAYTQIQKPIKNDSFKEIVPNIIKNFSLNPVTKVEELESPIYCTDKTEYAKAVSEIQTILGNDINNYTISKTELDSHADSYFNTHHAKATQHPSLVVFPHSTDDVSKICKVANKYSIPIVPFSGGTSIEGHFVSTRGYPTIVIDLSRYMSEIVRLDQEDLDVTVQAGVGWEDCNEFLSDYGLMLGIDPGPGAQIGGCIANSCSGTNAYRYGTMKENIINMTVVLSDGSIIKTRGNGKPRKSSAGYNLNGLFVGSEGTLGIVTEATLKTHVKSQFEQIAVISFPSIKNAASCASMFLQNGIQLNAIELLDANMMHIVNLSKETFRTDWNELPTLFIKFGGVSKEILASMANEMKKIAKKNNAEKVEYSTSEENKLELWEARKIALWSVIDNGKTKNTNAKLWTTDVAVPISKFPKVIEDTQLDLKKSKLLNAIVGHAGDGNFHSFIVYNNDEEMKLCKKIVDKMVRRAIENNGTCTGEHGIGLGKREYLEEELDENTIGVMRTVKLAMDKKRIMNPDKIFKMDPHDNDD